MFLCLSLCLSLSLSHSGSLSFFIFLCLCLSSPLYLSHSLSCLVIFRNLLSKTRPNKSVLIFIVCHFALPSSCHLYLSLMRIIFGLKLQVPLLNILLTCHHMLLNCVRICIFRSRRTVVIPIYWNERVKKALVTSLILSKLDHCNT